MIINLHNYYIIGSWKIINCNHLIMHHSIGVQGKSFTIAYKIALLKRQFTEKHGVNHESCKSFVLAYFILYGMHIKMYEHTIMKKYECKKL